MSWFFGKKKHHKDSPPDSPEEENPPAVQGDDFIFIERRGNPPPSGPGIGDSFEPPNGLYPNISGMPPYPTALPAASPKQNAQMDVQHFLNGVPFKLCKELASNAADDADIDRLRVNEILSYITRLEGDEDEYDFSLEKSVLNEMDSTI